MGIHEDRIREQVITVRVQHDDKAELLHEAPRLRDHDRDQNLSHEVEQAMTTIVVAAEVVAEVAAPHAKKICTIQENKSPFPKQSSTNQTGQRHHLSEPHYIGIMHVSALHADP